MATTGLHIETPLLGSLPLSSAAGTPVVLKMEALQPSGSFKLRGIGRLCENARRAGATEFVASSGGNAGLAVAYAGQRLGARVTVVVPLTTSGDTCQQIADYGAHVLVHGAAWDEADARAREIVADRGALYVPPFDHPEIWDGHATMIDEAAAQFADASSSDPKLERPGLVVLSVGGGGLLCGVLEGLERNGWTDVPVLAVETEGAASFAAACAAGEPVDIGAIRSVATSLGARKVAAAAIDWRARHAIESLCVSDVDALTACARFLDDHRVLVEPACGAALAPVYAATEQVRNADSVLVVVCGGACVSRGQLDAWLRDC